MYVDPTGQAWWHWVLGAAIVAVCAVATVVTCGGFAAAATDGWIKMGYNVNGVETHFVYNPTTQAFDDFKFTR